MGVAKKKLMVVGNWAAIVKNKKVLIVKRDSQEILGAGTWSIPGGKSEKGKDCYKNLDREVLEESDLKIKNSKLMIQSKSRMVRLPLIWALILVVGMVKY